MKQMKLTFPFFLILSLLACCTLLQSFQVNAANTETGTVVPEGEAETEAAVESEVVPVPDEFTDKKLARQCSRKAREEKCDEPEVRQKCPKTCEAWDAQQKLAPRESWVDIDRDDYWFFDLTAKLQVEQEWINFERFEGYLTLVANIGKICETNVDLEFVVDAMKTLFHVMPYSLNIILFPFTPPRVVNTECTLWDQAIQKSAEDKELKGKMFIMEEAILNGPDTHPVYKYLKEKTDLDEMLESHSSFFFVNGEGTKIDLFQGANFQQLRDHVVRLTNERYASTSKVKYEL